MAEPALCRCYYSCNNYPNSYFDMPITRWDEGNWDLVIETSLPSGDRDTLFSNLVPNAVSELYNVLGTPFYKDITWSSGNTLRISPIGGAGISSLREERIIAVKSIQDNFLTKNRFSVKIEGVRIDV